ncbi:MAG: hypothetical protein ACQSGP_29730, partial [Frankia sp.]
MEGGGAMGLDGPSVDRAPLGIGPTDGGAAVDGFLPSTHAFAFTNDFPRGPVFQVGPAGGPKVLIGDASRDLFEAGRRPPPTDQPPA